MLPPPREAKIEDTVELELKYPSVTERYWTKHYFIPKEKKKPDTGKLVEVRLTYPKLVSERPDAEGYLAVILPPIKNGDGPLRRLISAQQYQELY